MRLLVLTVVVTSTAGTLLLVANPNLFGECKHETPNSELCPEPATVTNCKQTTIASGKKCSDYNEQDVVDGAFGCQDNGNRKTQCLNASKNQQGSLVLCYTEYRCTPLIDGSDTCQQNNRTATSHFRRMKIQKPCVGS